MLIQSLVHYLGAAVVQNAVAVQKKTNIDSVIAWLKVQTLSAA